MLLLWKLSGFFNEKKAQNNKIYLNETELFNLIYQPQTVE